tara:strand:+ start:2306 stop:2497 length:192 start_codon:yes stop_codon:yes gene_type:complete
MSEIRKVSDKESFKCHQCTETKYGAKYIWNTPITKNTYELCNSCCTREFKKIKKQIDEKYKGE